MEIEILTKIYRLRQIKADTAFTRSTKENLFASEEVASKESVFFSPLFQHSFVVAGAFAFLLIFGYLAFPLVPEYQTHVVSYPEEFLAGRYQEEEDELNRVADYGNGNNREIAITDQPIKQEFATLEESLRTVQRQVFGMMISEETGEEKISYSDKEIAEYLIVEMEGEETQEISIMTMDVEKESKRRNGEKIKRAKEALEDENYGRVFDIYLERE